MGRWGGGLFQGDTDYDLIGGLDLKIGLVDIANDANRAAGLNPETEDEEEYDRLKRYSIYAPFCSSEETIQVTKNHLEAGKLLEMGAEYEPNGPSIFGLWLRTEYDLCILGACAMKLGCNIAPPFLGLLKCIYMRAGFFPEGQEQMRKALYGFGGFVNGQQYDFGSLGLIETANMMAMEDATNDKVTAAEANEQAIESSGAAKASQKAS